MFRGRATANHLAQAGWDVTVVTAPREFFTRHLRGAVDESLESTVDPRIRVERPKMYAYAWETDVRRYGILRRNFPVVMDKLYRSIEALVFPEYYLGWVPGVLRRALWLHARRPFDVIVATGNPFVSFAAAWLLGRMLRRPYVIDYRDAWTVNQFTEQLIYPPGSRMLWWEQRVLRDAAEILFVNQAMRDWHAQRYPFAADRMTVVRNGWDPEVLGRSAFRRPDPHRPLRFAYIGTVTTHLPLDTVFEAWRLARAHPLLADAQLDIYGHLGFFPNNVDPIRQRIAQEEDAAVYYRGPFHKTEAAGIYDKADVLIFCPGGTKYVTSAKVFEYIATGKPIVSIHQPHIAAEEVLSDYPLWFSGSRLDPEAGAEALIAAAKAVRDIDISLYEAALAHAQKYTRDAALQPWEARLRALAERAR